MKSKRFLRGCLVLGFCLALPHPAASQATVTFDFDTGTPAVVPGQSTPFVQTSGGVTADFSSPSAAAFSIQSDATTGWRMSKFSGNYLSDNGLGSNVLVVKFSKRLTGITFTFATADFQQVEVPTTIQLKAYLDSNATPLIIGPATAHGTYASDTMPMGTLSFNSGSQPFNLVEISIPYQPRGASDFFVDNITVTPSPVITSVSAASFVPSAPLTPEMIVVGLGWGLAADTAVAPPDAPLPTSLAGTTVKLKDSAGTERLCPLWFVSPGQINYYVPAGSQAGPATVTFANQTGVVVTGQVQIGVVSPGLFTMNSDGQGAASAIAIWTQPDGTQTWQYVFPMGCVPGSCTTTPLDMGASGVRLYLVLYGTGIRGRSALSAVTATIGGVDATVEYAGLVAGFVGLDQVNVAVPVSLARRGEVDLVLTVDGLTANPVKVNFK